MDWDPISDFSLLGLLDYEDLSALEVSMGRQAESAVSGFYGLGMRAGRIGRLIWKAERKMVSRAPFSYLSHAARQAFMILLNVVIVLLIASVAFPVALLVGGMVALANLPVPEEDGSVPGIDDIDHPAHRTTYPERYDDYGSFR
ncbi:hypothetical protein [Pseudomonas fluorescens]|uniref:hypothetical protein n=1 Tax=Pseudomonas fluorescens TaxID=294 RepID=UPI0012B7792E|nr:hypothetical protein [Pseudomonas fluorescens]